MAPVLGCLPTQGTGPSITESGRELCHVLDVQREISGGVGSDLMEMDAQNYWSRKARRLAKQFQLGALFLQGAGLRRKPSVLANECTTIYCQTRLQDLLKPKGKEAKGSGALGSKVRTCGSCSWSFLGV
eukprot:554024-Pelagomonas_calceolata.AAC.1